MFLVKLFNLALVLFVRSQQITQENFFACSKRESLNTTMLTVPIISRIQCGAKCLKHSQCKSGHFCQEDDGTKLCSLGSDWPFGGCDVLPISAKCSSFKIVNPCENGGSLTPDGYNCTCPSVWYDTFCQRHRYDCIELEGSGSIVMGIQPKNYDKALLVVCQQQQNLLVGYFVSRINPGDLNKTYEEYKTGFFVKFASWMGLETMHALTSQGEYRLTIKPNSITGLQVVYDDFNVSSESEGYSFNYGTFRADLSNLIDGFAANPSIGSGSLVGVPFSTYDKDPYGCAALYGAGWWYDSNCGPVLVYDPTSGRGRWPDTPTTLKNAPTFHFVFKLMRYY
ncbi:uncharacterized protein LOC124281669 [Haliotis rubra]|uniref:uncharacterized protein LOC124281669 n=1 Tax=Haliotis rubra TaxID=36100 RepID=UPI001EE58938|nr:uncharacterized protein LOC124281669 [Haliotis rubra]